MGNGIESAASPGYNAPIDDEPETEEERRAVAEAREEIARGEVISAEEIKCEIA